MAYVTQGAARHPVSAGWFARLADTIRRARLERRTYNQLIALSDRELEDLGLARGDIAEVARKAALGL